MKTHSQVFDRIRLVVLDSPPLPAEQLLDIDMMSQYIMHHGRLGSSNAMYGVAVNVALQANRCSVFGYSLGRVGHTRGSPHYGGGSR